MSFIPNLTLSWYNRSADTSSYFSWPSFSKQQAAHDTLFRQLGEVDAKLAEIRGRLKSHQAALAMSDVSTFRVLASKIRVTYLIDTAAHNRTGTI